MENQVYPRIIDATANCMGIGTEKEMINIHRFGNTTAATILLCLWEWEKQLKKELILFSQHLEVDLPGVRFGSNGLTILNKLNL
jgi:3-oxoacyl-[acyl-carrier-protein] synthase III